ncbi:MAG: hypothetical protein HRF51_04450 [bacterium]
MKTPARRGGGIQKLLIWFHQVGHQTALALCGFRVKPGMTLAVRRDSPARSGASLTALEKVKTSRNVK